MRKIKILYLIPQLLTGGTERHLCDLVTHLDEEKFKPVVWCIGQWGPIGEEIVSSGIKVVNQSLRFYRIDDILNAFWLVRKGHFDIFHSYSYGSFFIDAIISKVAGIPIYISSRRNIRHWSGGNRLHIGERIRNQISDIVIANSEAVKKRSIEIEKICPDKIKVIYNGVNIENIKKKNENTGSNLQERLNISDDYLIIGNLSNLKQIKGQKYLILAFAKVLERTGKKLKLVIIGEGPEKEKLIDLAVQQNIVKDVIVTNLTTNRFAILNTFDIFVLPSLAEGFSNVVIEAMAMKKPMIATDVGGNREAIVDGKTGYLVPPRDPDAIAKALIEMVSNKNIMYRFEKNGKKRIEDHFRLIDMIKKYEQIYNSTISTFHK